MHLRAHSQQPEMKDLRQAEEGVLERLRARGRADTALFGGDGSGGTPARTRTRRVVARDADGGHRNACAHADAPPATRTNFTGSK